jgi:FtsP/CotA-like multicopper oxidase with cupredoxin domain
LHATRRGPKGSKPACHGVPLSLRSRTDALRRPLRGPPGNVALGQTDIADLGGEAVTLEVRSGRTNFGEATGFPINDGPDEPFGGGVPNRDVDAADPATTGQVMKCVVVPLASSDTRVPPDRLTLPTFPPLGAASKRRQVSLNEEESTFPGFDGPMAALPGTLHSEGNPVPMRWEEAITENPAVNSIEIWEMDNFTADAHPIHIHEVQFQVVNRQPFGRRATRPPESWETDCKDTVIAYPDEITRVKTLFDNPGLFVWHQVLSVHPHPTERSR